MPTNNMSYVHLFVTKYMIVVLMVQGGEMQSGKAAELRRTGPHLHLLLSSSYWRVCTAINELHTYCTCCVVLMLPWLVVVVLYSSSFTARS